MSSKYSNIKLDLQNIIYQLRGNFVKVNNFDIPIEHPNKTYCNKCYKRVIAECRGKYNCLKCSNGHIWHIDKNYKIVEKQFCNC